MHENDVPPNQLNIKLIPKNNKNVPLHYLKVTKIRKSNDAHYCDTVKGEQKTYKKGANLQISRKLIL